MNNTHSSCFGSVFSFSNNNNNNEIHVNNNNSKKIIVIPNHYRNIFKGDTNNLTGFKSVLVGYSGVGKTCFVKASINKTFNDNKNTIAVENLILNVDNYKRNILFAFTYLFYCLKSIYLEMNLTDFNDKFFDQQIKLLETNNVDTHLKVNITNKSNLNNYSNLIEYKDVIYTLNCYNVNIIKDLSCYTNLQEIHFSNVESNIILTEMPYLSSIYLYKCNGLVVSDCKNLNSIRISNVKNLNIYDGNIKIDKIKFLSFRFENEKIINLQMKINFIQSFTDDYKYIKKNQEVLLKNNLNINQIIINNCNLNNNEVRYIQSFINKYNLFKSINLCLKNNIFNAKLIIEDKKIFLESSQFFVIENKDGNFIIDNIYSYNVTNFTIMSTKYRNKNNRNIKLVNFDSLLDLTVETRNTVFDITELINLRSLTVLQENTINYNHLNLSKLIIKKNKNLNIKLNNLSNLKELEIIECEGVHLELENKRMKLQNITLEKLRNVNINLKLNCPELYKFYFSCYEIESDIINFEFCNTPIVFIPKIEILQPENLFITSK
ncbi:hypothetical protein ABK040_016112 [Willaertia magna]